MLCIQPSEKTLYTDFLSEDLDIFFLKIWIFKQGVGGSVPIGGSDLKEVSWIQSGNLRLYAPTTTFQWWHQHVTNEWRISSIELKLENWSEDKKATGLQLSAFF